MDALLQNIPKPDRRHEMGVSLGVDLSGLDVCFGGFSPTLMGDAMLALGKAEESEVRLRERKATLERIEAIEAARASEIREWADEFENVWRYTVLDGEEVRIQNVEVSAFDLIIPDSIEGLPVVAIAADACAHQPNIESVVVPDSVLSIGYCAFRNCTSLAKAVLPVKVAEYDSGWFRNCTALEDLALPGSLEIIRPNIFDNAGIKHLRIGSGTREVYPGAFRKSSLELVEVDEGNPFLETDGMAIYSRGRRALVALAVKRSEYDVSPECKVVMRKAMDGFQELVRAGLPDGVEIIGEHAFAHTGICEFVAPSALRAIMERAFFDCASLTEVRLSECIVSIGENAFTRTQIRELCLPASIEHIGHPVAADTSLVFAGPHATLRIETGADLALDEQGALLRKCEDGLHLEWLVDPAARCLKVPEGVVRIEPRALLNHRALCEVRMADSVIEIGQSAFKGCKKLRQVVLSRNLQRIDDEAFLDTSIEQLDLPASLEYIGQMALLTQTAHSGHAGTTLTRVDVDESNGRFRQENGMLLEHTGDGWRVLHYMDTVPEVLIPDSVTSIAPYAFSGAQNLRVLCLRDGISDIGIRAFAVDCLIRSIRIDMREPVEGHDFFDIRFPDTDRGEHQQFVALTSAEGFSVPSLLEHYDCSIANASNFDSILGGEGLGSYEQAVRIIDRLQDPVYLTPVNRELLERVVRMHLPEMCVAIAKHDDRESLDALAQLGILNDRNIDDMVEKVGAVQDAAMTGYLLEMRRRCFGRAVLDFDL